MFAPPRLEVGQSTTRPLALLDNNMGGDRLECMTISCKR